MTDTTTVSTGDHAETRYGLVDAMQELFRQWRAVNPRAPKSRFVSLAEQATQPQQSALFPSPNAAPVTRLHAALGTDTDVWFADFWRTYPRKVGKRDARQAWARAVRRCGDPAVVLRGARAYAADPNLPEAQFVPHPSTWLNGDRWEDGPLPARHVPQPARTTRALVGLATHTASKTLPALPGAGR